MVELEWAICPVCNRRYGYVACFKPKTCNSRCCVESPLGQSLINGSGMVDEHQIRVEHIEQVNERKGVK